MSRLWEGLMQVVYPHHCFLCNEVLPAHQRLCAACAQKAPYVLPPVCELCGRGEDSCSCGNRHRAFARCVTPFYYRDAAKSGVETLKEHGYRVTVDGFGEEMAEMVRREYGGIAFDWVTAVPLHRQDWRRRGFDQAALLAQNVAARIGVPYLTCLRKVTATQPQKELSALQRSGNLLGVFDILCPEKVEDSTILLVDDVITTGATLDECAKMLKIYGAREVYALTAAGAVLKKAEK